MSNFERNIFTQSKPSRLETLADIVSSIVLAGALAVGLLAYFDVLFM